MFTFYKISYISKILYLCYIVDKKSTPIIMNRLTTFVSICYFLVCLTTNLYAQYDLVFTGARVMDPASGLDAVLNIGITGDKIRAISKVDLDGIETIDISGKVLSPGFIDPHVHGITNDAHRYQARDGVTTALELESGIPFYGKWLDSKAGKSIVNYGGSVPHSSLRAMAMDDYKVFFERANEIVATEGLDSPDLDKVLINMNRSIHQSLSETELIKLNDLINDYLEKGALGIGVPVGYYPGANGREMFEVYKAAAQQKMLIFSHTRGFGLAGINEAIANATATGASLHIVHANSLSLSEIDVTLDLVQSAQDRGLDITTEVYPYTAASTSLGSVLFDEGWQDDLGISYGDLQWQATGERLTEETFKKYRESGGIVIIHMMKDEWIEKGISHPVSMIGSDGMPFHPNAHPRTAGTYARVLGKYVREDKVLSLMDALKKMTIMPAIRLETISPMMKKKGRIQIGCDADITIFDPEKIIDKADFDGLQFSEGIDHVLVNGTFVVKNGENVDNVFPGQPILNHRLKKVKP